MELKENLKELATILFAIIILSISISLKNKDFLLIAPISFLIIILANTFIKKIIGYMLELKVRTKFWSVYHYGFRKDSHFNKPLPMAWLPLLVSLITKGFFWWLPILEFDVEAKTERVSRRHGLYRFSEVTEWHMAWIAIFGLISNITLAIAAYFLGYEFFTKLSIYYTAYSIIPFSSLDGSKIFFGNRSLWMITSFIVLLITIWSFLIF